MKNKKGFTLIELSAVIVILGLIMIIVFPSISRLMMTNSKKKYSTYEDLLKEAAEKYAFTRMADLGGIQGSGCIEDITIENLEDANLIKPLGEEDITCGLPVNFDLSEYRGIDPSKDYVTIRVRNEKGKLKVEMSLVCVNKKNKVVYKDLITKEESGACERYKAESSIVLLNTLKERATLGGVVATTEDNETYFYDNNENYVAYSGMLWRIVSYNVTSRTIKLVTAEDITVMNYDNTTNEFRGSNIDNWLNEEFRQNLRDYPQFLEEAEWNYSQVSSGATKPPTTNVVQRYVGLLNLYEETKNNSINPDKKNFLLSKANATQVWTRTAGTNTAANANNFYAIRPSVVLRSEVPYIGGGTGTSSNPYKLAGEQLNAVNPKLESRYIGEYVKFDDNASRFRIIGKTGSYIKLVYDGVLSLSAFDTNFVDIYTAGTTIGTYNNNWFTNLYDSLNDNDQKLLLNGDFDGLENVDEEDKYILGDYCTSIVDFTTDYQPICRNEDVRSLKVGLLKIGDMFAVPQAGGSYWTVNRYEEKKINVITNSDSNGYITNIPITNVANVRPVIAVSKDAYIKIDVGAGTSTNPYIIYKKVD